MFLDCRHVCKMCAFHYALQAGKQKEVHRTPLIWCLQANFLDTTYVWEQSFRYFILEWFCVKCTWIFWVCFYSLTVKWHWVMGNYGRRVSALSLGHSYVSESKRMCAGGSSHGFKYYLWKERILLFWTMLPLSSENIKSWLFWRTLHLFPYVS
jgi:hypothetical protein